MYRDQKISVVIPCLNEEKGLPQVLSGRLSFVDEVIVVDNGSTDRSAEVARDGGALVIHEQRRGYGQACRTGLNGASGDIVVTLDADNNLLMSDVHPILDYMLDNKLDFVNGTRFPMADKDLMPLAVRLSNRFISWTIRRLFRIPVQDSQCGFMAFRSSIIPKLALSEPGMTFSQEAKIKVWTDPSLRAGERPIQYGKRTGTRKFEAVADSVQILRHAFAMRKRTPARPRSA
jgi:glycosyltransferase involved in cell wall biosynthesis